MRFFLLSWYGQKNPLELLINHLMYFRFRLQICRDIQIFVYFVCSQNTGNFVPRIIRIFRSLYYQNFVFRVLSEFFVLSIISIRTISFRVLSANAKFFLKWNTHSAYSQYELKFVPRILIIHKISFRVFSL
jgi:hypothetical protein